MLQIAQVIFVPKVDRTGERRRTTVAEKDAPVATARGVNVRWLAAVPVTDVPVVAVASETPGIGGSALSSRILDAVADADWYTVVPGDTVISIALRYQLEWQALLALNGLNDDTLLQVGQRLRLR